MEEFRNCPRELVDVNQTDSGKDIKVVGIDTTTHLKRRRKKPEGAVLRCEICGHVTLGYHFNALTCEACKAFFRRNANKKDMPSCCFAGKCSLDQKSRKLCSGCRLNKCFEVGMKKEWILGKDQLKQRRRNSPRTALEEKTKPVISHEKIVMPNSMTKPVTSLEMTTITDRPMTKPVISHKKMALSQPMTRPFISDKMMALSQPITKPVRSHEMTAMSDQPMTKPITPRQMTCMFDQPVMSHDMTAMSDQPMVKPVLSLEMAALSYQPMTKPDISYEMMAMSQPMTKLVMSHESTALSDQPMIKPVTSFEKTAITERPMTKPVMSYELKSMSQPVTKTAMSHKMMAVSKLMTNSDLKSENCRIDDPVPVTHWSHSNYECFPEMISMSSDKKKNNDDFLQPLSPVLEAELYMLAESYKSVLDSGLTENNMKKVLTKPCNANELFTMSEILIRNLVKFVKLLPDFKSIEQHDRVILLKGSMMEAIVLRSALYFDPVNHKWKTRCKQSNESTFINASILLKQLGESVYIEHMEFAQSLKQLTNMDNTIIALILVHVIFSPDRPHLKNRSAVIQTRDKFSYWLHIYLKSTLSVKKAQSVYENILTKLLDMRQLAERFAKITWQLDAAKLEPLVVEVLVPQKDNGAVELQWDGNSFQI